MPQALQQPPLVEQDFLPLNGTDYVEFYVATPARPRIIIEPLSASVWRLIADRKRVCATPPPTSWCKIKFASC